MGQSIEVRLKGTRRGFFFREFFNNSAYFPLVNIILELLLSDPRDYLLEPDPYMILAAALIQAHYISRWAYDDQPRPLFGNLIGPLIYTLIELAIDGDEFTATLNHFAYWGFSIAIGLAQQMRLWLPPRHAEVMILGENLLRTSILVVMYTILEFIQDDYASIAVFLNDATHLFVVATVFFIGTIIGFGHINAERYLQILRETAGQLREYSEWLLGKELLALAVHNPHALSLSRHERAILFMDIRGFTAWSEGREPEAVVALMNAYYEAAEPVWRHTHAIKVKFTADEIMLVFADSRDASAAATALRQAVQPMLESNGLTAGIGVHCGPVVEGLMGASDRKGYDLLGDSVNTAKRLCDNAGGGEILLSQTVAERLGEEVILGTARLLMVKGKQEPVTVYPLA